MWPFVIIFGANSLLVFTERNDLRDRNSVGILFVLYTTVLFVIWMFTDYVTANMVKEDYKRRVDVDLTTYTPSLIILWSLTIISGILCKLFFESYKKLFKDKNKHFMLKNRI